ncbi:MAG: SEL1-like repeat protein [Gammaproteobacteria bacterium]|nr:SEL1-like repeat protein [Gammaproteobacteria bacterium]
MRCSWGQFSVVRVFLLPIVVLAASGEANVNATAAPPDKATPEAARFIVINAGGLIDTIRVIAFNQVMMQGMGEIGTALSGKTQGSKSKRDAKARLDKATQAFTEEILNEVSQHRAQFETSFSGEEPELQRLQEAANWTKATTYLAKLPKYQNKPLPDLRTRLDDAAFALWIKALLSPPTGKNAKVEHNPLLEALSELRAFLDDFDPKLAEQRARVKQRNEFFAAIRANDLSRVEALIAAGEAVESSDAHETADAVPLLAAIEAANPAMVILLRQHGAGKTPEQLTRALAVAAERQPPLFPVLLKGAKFPNEAPLNKALSDLAYDLLREERYTELALLLPTVGDVDGLTHYDRPLLYEAIDKENLEVATLLLESGANPNTEVRTWGTLLKIAMEKKNPNLVELLLNHGANPNPTPDKYGRTLLANLLDTSFDLNADQVLIADKLAAAGAKLTIDDGAKACQIVIQHAQRLGKSAVVLAEQFHVDARHSSATDLGCLWQAVEQDELDLAQWALKQGATTAVRDEKGATLLHHLAHSGHASAPALIRQLVHAGVNPNQADANGDTPLHVAALYEKQGRVPVLFEVGADPNRYNKQDQLAFEKLMPDDNGIPWVLEFIQHGQDMNAIVSQGQTVFTSFATYASTEQLQWFFSKPREFDLNMPDANGYTTLAHLLLYGKLQAARMVYQHGALIDRGELQGRTPLHYAASQGRMELLPVILDEMHANPNAVNYDGYNAIDFAHAGAHAEVAQWLKARVTGPFPDATAIQADLHENNRRYLAMARQHKHLTSDMMLNIGFIYENGEGVTQDYNQAQSWYRKAAELDNALAQYNLGLLYENGRGVKQDYAEAVSWYRKSAEQDYASAQNNLAFMYNHGQGVPQDHVEAFAWLQKAAEQGFAMAQANLAEMYINGEGTKKNKTMAIRWYKKAAEQGDEAAITALKTLTRKSNEKKPVISNR